MICKAARLELGQELEPLQGNKVLELLKQRLATRRKEETKGLRKVYRRLHKESKERKSLKKGGQQLP
jgi:hypothetical protein